MDNSTNKICLCIDTTDSVLQFVQFDIPIGYLDGEVRKSKHDYIHNP